MAKFVILFVMAILAVCVQGFPYHQNDIASAAAEGQWDVVHRLLNERLRARFQLSPVNEGHQTNDADIKNLQPVDGGHVYGESKFEYHSASNVNGQTDEHSGGHQVINKDGLVTEFDYTPQH